MRPSPRSALLALAAALAFGLGLAVVLGRTGGHSTRGPLSSSSSTAVEHASATGFYGAPLPAGITAPDWTLTDQAGQRVALSDYRGQVLILSFLSPTTSGTSPLIVQQIRGALNDLSRPVPAVAISADPALDTPARVHRFLGAVSLSARLRYLTGTPAQLSAVWRAYHVVPLSAGRAQFEAAATVLLIDGQGHERVLFGVEQLTPEGLAHDVEKLRGG